MTARPCFVCRELPDIGAVSVHDEDLLASVFVYELIKGDALAVG